MLVQVDEFSYNNGFIDIVIRVYLETSTEVVTYQAWEIDDGVEIEITGEFGTLTTEQRNKAVDTVIFSGCIGFDLWDVRASMADPFGYVHAVTRNTAVCGWTEPCNIEITNVLTTTPTFTTANDGKATIVATSSAAIEYSIDGINYKPDNLFENLFPGEYLAYARDINGCSDIYDFTIAEAVNPFPEATGYPWEKKVCRWFKLKIGDTTTPIREPIKWDSIGITGDRDAKWHGWNWQYSDGDVQLEFDCPAGKDLLVSAYEADGNDADVELLFGFTLDGDDYQLYQGRIDFNTWKRFANKVTATVVRKDFMDMITSRMDEKYTVTKEEDFAGNVLEPLAGFDITLHGKEFATRFELDKPEEVFIEKADYFDTQGHLFLFDFDNPALNEIQDFVGLTGLIMSGRGEPYGIDLYTWKLINNGTYVISFDAQFTYTLQNSRVTGLLIKDDYRMRVVYGHRRAGVVTETILAEHLGKIGANDTQTKTFTIAFDLTINYIAGDEIFIYGHAENLDTDRRSRARFYQRNVLLTIDAIETREDSECKVWWMDDVVNYGIKTTSENRVRFKSRWIEKAGGNFAGNGPFSLYVLTNGYNIRRFIEQRPLITSVKQALESIQAISSAGMGLEKDGPNWNLRIEPIEYFYQDVLILYIEEVSEYSEETARELIFNAVEIGYDKYEEDGIQQLDEFNTKHEYTTPIKTYKNKLEQKSKFIASGYSLEVSRRNQFAETSKDSVTNDEDPFIISVRKDGLDVIPEKNEAFETITNLISPQTSYNIRLSPKRMLLNWWRWLKGSFFFKDATEEIKNSFVDRNGAMNTKFLVTEPNLLGDVSRDLLQENNPVILSDYGDGDPIYRPEWVNIKCRLNPGQVEAINNAMTGGDRAYGYIMVKKPDGDWQAFWLYKITYSYASEKAELRGLKKYSTPAYPVGECCPWLVANGCYILANGEKLIA